MDARSRLPDTFRPFLFLSAQGFTYNSCAIITVIAKSGATEAISSRRWGLFCYIFALAGDAIADRASLSIGIDYTLQVWGQKHTPPTDAALILGLEAVFAVAAGWFVLNQTLLSIQIIGCLIIFIAVLISQTKS